MTVEGVLLTGGSSRRMGKDKASLLFDGEPLAERIANRLASSCERVIVLGRNPVATYEFLLDRSEFAGPLAALGDFQPSCPLVFLASCDIPRFDARIVGLCFQCLEDFDAVFPEVDGRVQPLCGLYRAEAWQQLRDSLNDGKRNLMAWVDRLNYRSLSEVQMVDAGIDPRVVRGANSPEELRKLELGEQGLA